MKYKAWFVWLDFCAFFAILFGVVALRTGQLNWTHYLYNVEVFLPIFVLCAFFLWIFSFYDVQSMRKRTVHYKMLSVAFVLSVLSSAAVIYFVAPVYAIVTPKTVLVAVLLLFFGYVYWERKTYFKLDFAKTNLLLFGDSPTMTEILDEIKRSAGFKLRAHEAAPQADKAYSLRNLDQVIVSRQLLDANSAAWQRIARDFIAKGASVDSDFNAFERMFRRVSRESISNGVWLLFGVGNRRDSYSYPMLKRAMDIILSCLMLPFLVPLGLLIYCFIRVVDKYPPFFVQKRVGYLEKPIYVYKFRTIKPGGTEADITRSGKILRRFRLDEIPQIINVLKGDISFVGPRPIWSNEYEFLKKYIPNHNLRTIVKPGITGWAQLNFKAPPTYFNFRNDQPDKIEPHAFDAAFTRFSYDVWYIKNRSLWLDIEIMIKTGIRAFIKDSYVG